MAFNITAAANNALMIFLVGLAGYAAGWIILSELKKQKEEQAKKAQEKKDEPSKEG